MHSLAFKALFRKKGTASAIIAIALLIALLTSINCLVNNITAQTTALTKLATIGETYLVTSEDATALSDSQIDPQIINKITNHPSVKSAYAQLLQQAILTTNNQSHPVTVTGVNDVKGFLQKNQASINGSFSQKPNEANVGIILSALAALNRNDPVTLTFGDQSTELKIVGITRTTQQSDTQLIMPLETLQELTQTTAVSFIEFSVKNPTHTDSTLKSFSQTLPQNVKITGTQPLIQFASDINNQTVNFINVWSIAIYAVVVAASYVTASRLINEAQYDLYTLRSLGVKKRTTTNLILLFTVTIVLIGAIIGVSLGIVGSQVASSGVRLLWGNTQLAPFIEANQAIQVLLIALFTSVLGAVYPAVKAAQTVGRMTPQ